MRNTKKRVLFALSCCLVFFFTVVLAHSNPTAKDTTEYGTVSGRFVVKGGGSMSGGQVALYRAEDGNPPKFNRYSRIPNIISEIDVDGRFTADVPSGSYYLVAIKRLSGAPLGPPGEEDYTFRLMHKDLAARKLFIPAGENLDLGTLEVVPGSRVRATAAGSITTIRGVLRDRAGNPVDNGIVFAYQTPEMQGQKPQFVSNFTGSNGQYALRVAGNSTYYLLAREVLGGGKPEVGEIIGMYGTNEPLGISVQTGAMIGSKDITVSRVQPRGPREAEYAAGGGLKRQPAATGYLTGQVVMEDGSPLGGAIVYLFAVEQKQAAEPERADQNAFWWELDQMVGQLDRHGKFDVEVPEGDYDLTIIKRASGKVMEPLQVGDVYYLHGVAGGGKTVTVKAGEETALGKLVGYRYTGRGLADYPNKTAIASIYGTLTDRKGQPVPGAHILVYSKPDRLGPPLFSGGPSKADGSYNMMFYKEGTYYLVAKSSQERRPGTKAMLQPGFLLGRYGGPAQKPLVIKNDDVKVGIDIVMQPVGIFLE